MGSKSKNRAQAQAKKETNMNNPYEDMQPVDAPVGEPTQDAAKTDEQVKEDTAGGEQDAGQAGDVSGDQKEDGPDDGQDDGVDEVAETAPVQEPVTIPAGMAKVPPMPVDRFQLPLSCSPSSQLAIHELKDYIEAMSAKVTMPSERGGQVQMNLYYTLLQIINTRAEDFDAVFGLAMQLIQANLKGVFSDENIHRYTPHVVMPSKTIAHFRYLLSALTALAAPQSRQLALRHVNLAQAFQNPRIKEESRQRVLNYFNV
jgi:hypothetical protein